MIIMAEYIVLETEVLFRPCLTSCNKKADVFIPPSWVQLDYVVVFHEQLLKRTEHLATRKSFSHRNMPTLGRVDEFSIREKNYRVLEDL